MSTRSGIIYAKSFEPFAKKTKIHHTVTESSVTTKKSHINDTDSSSDYSDCEEEYRPIYEVNIDFDQASIAWRANKRRVGESWVYTKPATKKRTYVSVISTLPDSIASRIKLRTHP